LLCIVGCYRFASIDNVRSDGGQEIQTELALSSFPRWRESGNLLKKSDTRICGHDEFKALAKVPHF